MSLASDFRPEHDASTRLAVLQLLAAQPMGNANDASLYEAVNAAGMPCSREQMRAHLFWLGAQLLVSTLDLRTSTGFVVATLTERGGDVAAGRSLVAGVARPKRD